MTPNKLLQNVAVLIEEVATPQYDRDTGDEQPITAEQWDVLDERFRMIVLMNKPRSDGHERTDRSNA